MNQIKELLITAWRWLRVDGLLHMLVSALLVALLGAFLPLWVGVIVVAGIGIMKELYDFYSKKGTAELHDLICDVIGIVVGVLIWLMY